jgi:hypothetical protein
MSTDISKEHVSIFRVQESSKLAARTMLVFCLAYFSTMKMKATFSSESSDKFHKITLRFISQHLILKHYIVLQCQVNKYLTRCFSRNGQNIPKFYSTRRFITMFTSAPHWHLSCARLIQSMPYHISLRCVLIKSCHPRLDLHSSSLFLSRLYTRIP